MLYNLISLYFFIIILSVVYWVAIIRALGASRYANTVSLLCLAICLYIFGYTLELNSTTPAQIRFWNRFEYLGIPFVSALWLTVGLIYTERFARHRVIYSLLIFVIPLVSLVLRQTNDYHHLYFASTQFVVQNGKLLLTRSYGLWMAVQSVHSMLMIVITLFLMLRNFTGAKGGVTGKHYMIAFASLLSVAGLMLSYIKPFGYVLDYMALCLPLSCLIVIIAITRYDFLELRSLARSKSFDANQDALILVGCNARIIDFNRNAARLLAQKGVTLRNGDIAHVLGNAPTLREALAQDETTVIQISPDADPQEKRYFEISTNWVERNANNQVCIKTLRDVTEAYELNLSLKQQVLFDDLSGLHNRRAFVQLGSQMLQGAIAAGLPAALIMMDLDHFKAINDAYGHPTGDHIIQEFAKTLRQSFPPDSLLARLGGEEFGVLAVGAQTRELQKLTERFVEAVAMQTHMAQEHSYRVTVSAGIAVANTAQPGWEISPQQALYRMMAMADKALYRAKEHGRNRVFPYVEHKPNAVATKEAGA